MLRGASLFSLLNLKSNPKSCTLPILTFLLNNGSISNLADRRLILTISFASSSFNDRSVIMMRFSRPMSIRPMLTSVFSKDDSSLDTMPPISLCTSDI